ncbi:MAG TPA: hypothetical protein VN703_04970, partial [Candidatus Sulfopaludibacter sp.]|nr:hypothetical protein [Candidatus Sulfopaludibacter sp.]
MGLEKHSLLKWAERDLNPCGKRVPIVFLHVIQKSYTIDYRVIVCLIVKWAFLQLINYLAISSLFLSKNSITNQSKHSMDPMGFDSAMYKGT